MTIPSDKLAELKAKAAEVLARARAHRAANPAAFVRSKPANISNREPSDGFETAMNDIARKHQK